VLAYGFTENRQFVAKTNQNSVFLGCDHHISDQLYLMIPYKSFHGFFKKNQIFAQNPQLLAYGFTENHQFAEKADRNSVFISHDPHIRDRLYLMVLYMSFYVF
jgi:hypothetical protein